MQPAWVKQVSPALWMFAAALALRLIHLATIVDSPFFNHLYIDPGWYDEWGLRIASGELVGDRPFFLDPLYPYFIGAVYVVFGHEYVALGIIQGLLGAMVPPLLFLAARDWYDSPVPQLAGWTAVFYLPSIYFGGIVMKPGASLFLVTLVLWLLSRALVRDDIRLWFLTGLSFSLAVLTRGNLLLSLPVLVLWMLWRAPSTRGPRPAPDRLSALWPSLKRRSMNRRRWAEIAALSAGSALVLLLPAAHNYAVGGEWILTTANAGQNFYIGNNPTNSTGQYQQLPFVDPNPKYEQRDFEREAERRAGRELTDKQISRFWFAESWGWIREQPWAWGRLSATKLKAFWGAYEIPDSLDYYLYRRHAPVLLLPIPGFGLIAPLALLGAAFAVRRQGWPQLLFLLTVSYSASVIVFFVFSRFRMVIMPALFVFAAHAATELVQRWRRFLAGGADARPVVIATGLLVAFFVFVNIPVRAVADSWGYRVARALHLPARMQNTAQGHANLGMKLAAVAKDADDPRPWLQRAEAELREAARQKPKAWKFQVELAKVLARQERNEEAIEAYERAAARQPYHHRIHHGLGLLYRRIGDPIAAEKAFRSSLQIQPRFAPSAVQLGQVLLERGQTVEAAEFFRHALRLRPDDPVAREGLRMAASGP